MRPCPRQARNLARPNFEIRTAKDLGLQSVGNQITKTNNHEYKNTYSDIAEVDTVKNCIKISEIPNIKEDMAANNAAIEVVSKGLKIPIRALTKQSVSPPRRTGGSFSSAQMIE